MMAMPEFLAGGGEMGQRIREYNWAATPLGPVESWPQSLRTCIRIMLSSRQPIWIGWGKDLIKFYNDAYIAIVGGKHPSALGRPAAVVWRDVWREIAPMLRTVMEKGEGIYTESQLLIMERNGYPEETYYTFSYTPIPGDEGGTAGMICANTDDTERIISQRQLRTLMQLGQSLGDSESYPEAIGRTIHALKDNPRDFPFVLFYTMVQGEAKLTHFSPLGHAGKRIGDRGGLSFADGFREAMVTRAPVIVEELTDTIGELPTGAWEVPPGKAVIQPIYSAGEKEPYGFLVTGVNPYRLPDEKYLGFLSLVGDRVATSFADIHVLEVERSRAAVLAEIDLAKTTFFSNISHEFRTPLTLLLSPLEELLSEPRPGEPGYDNDSEMAGRRRYRLAVAYRNALRMQKLVNTLLEFSRIEAGRLEGQFRRVDIGLLTTDLASSFRSAIEQAGMRLYVGARQIDGDVYVDVDLWERIILNLVSNAFKYSRHGTISIDIRQEGDMVQVCVNDEGIGIPRVEQEKIFDRFHRVDHGEGRSQEGTGIGLAMVRELVRLHQGTITVTSAVGVGSTFTVSIPIGAAHLPPERIVEASRGQRRLQHAEAFVQEAMGWIGGHAEEAEEGDGAVRSGDGDGVIGAGEDGGRGGEGNDGEECAVSRERWDDVQDGSRPYTVLLADDNADMREYVQRLLSREYKVITAADGEEALTKMWRHKPDLVVSDVMMPRIDGFQLVKRIRHSPDLQDTPVILLSARAGEEAKVEGLECGADDYLVKPFTARELLARVEANIRIAKERNTAMRQYAEKLEQAVRRRTSELRALNGSLQRSNDDLQRFAHVASHDLKEPVRKIRVFSNRLLDEYAGILPDEARAWLTKIEKATERMQTMIEGVLNYSEINGAEQPITLVDLNTILYQVENDLELSIQESGAAIYRDDLPLLEGSPLLIYQLFYNMVNNSLKFCKEEENPLISVTARLTEAAGKRIAELSFADNGIGFAPDQSSRIFETFVRLNTKDRFEGTGLGLSLCKKIVERHHGSITATGEPGSGAVFVIRLPLTQPERHV